MLINCLGLKGLIKEPRCSINIFFNKGVVGGEADGSNTAKNNVLGTRILGFQAFPRDANDKIRTGHARVLNKRNHDNSFLQGR